MNKSWKELTADELTAIRELAADEASFNHMKSFMRQVNVMGTSEVYEPSVSVKSGLDAVFAKQHATRMPQPESTFRAPSAKIVPLYQRNWTKIAAAVIFVATAVLVWTWPGQQKIAPATHIAQIDEPIVFSDWNPEKEKEAEAPAIRQTKKVAESAERNDEITESRSSDRMEAVPMASSTVYAPDYFSVTDNSLEKGYEQKNSFADSTITTLKTGRNADLFPDSFYPGSVAAASEDLLSYIKPAF